jgi:hypothetical protein
MEEVRIFFICQMVATELAGWGLDAGPPCPAPESWGSHSWPAGHRPGPNPPAAVFAACPLLLAVGDSSLRPMVGYDSQVGSVEVEAVGGTASDFAQLGAAP